MLTFLALSSLLHAMTMCAPNTASPLAVVDVMWLPRNKYFELKNSWGCRPNSNYLPASITLGEGITHVQNTRQLHSVQTHQTCMQLRVHMHTQLTTHDKHTHAHTDCHSYHRQKEFCLRFLHVSRSISSSYQVFGKAESSSFEYSTAHHC